MAGCELFVGGLPVEGTSRSHQVPLLVNSEHPDHLKQLEEWMISFSGGRGEPLATAGYQNKLIEHKLYISKHGQDLPEIRNWKWKL